MKDYIIIFSAMDRVKAENEREAEETTRAFLEEKCFENIVITSICEMPQCEVENE